MSTKVGPLVDAWWRSMAAVTRQVAFLVATLAVVLLPSDGRRDAMSCAQEGSSEAVEQSNGDAAAESANTTPEQDGQPPVDDAGEQAIVGRVLDAEGQPAAGAAVSLEYRTGTATRSVETITDAAGRFEIERPADRAENFLVKITARSGDRSRMGLGSISLGQAEQPVEVKLNSFRTASLRVVDGGGRPVPAANAALQLPYPHVLTSRSDGSGVAAFDVPEGWKILTAVAWKSGVGLDYRSFELPREQRTDQLAKVPEFPADGSFTLRLIDAAPIEFRVTDEAGQPISGARVDPWLLRKDQNTELLNLSYFNPAFRLTTDERGVARIDWMPSWQKSQVTIFSGADGFIGQRTEYEPLTSGGEATAALIRPVPIRGRVTYPDGRPATGIQVVAAGKGYALDDTRETVVTDEAGEYEIAATPDQVYLVTVVDPQWAAAPQTGFAVLKGQPVDGKDFVLRKATRVIVKPVDSVSRQPVQMTHVSIEQVGTPLRELPAITIANPTKSNSVVQPSVAYSSLSREGDSFIFSLGDGGFNAWGYPQRAHHKFDVAGEGEVVVELEVVSEETSKLRGVVRTADDRKAVDGANVWGVPRDFMKDEWRATSDADGKIEVVRSATPTYVYAVTPDRGMADMEVIDAGQAEVSLDLMPTASVSGRLLHYDTEQPWPQAKIYYGVYLSDNDKGFTTHRFGAQVATDTEGNFRVDGLLPEHENELWFDSPPDSAGIHWSLSKLTLEPGEHRDLGEITPSPPPKPYVPPTPEELVRRAFEVPGTPKERLGKAVETATLVDQRILLLFGTPDDSLVQQFMQVRREDEAYRELGDNYRLLAIPTGGDAFDAAGDLADSLQVELKGANRDFCLVILDKSGARVDAAVANDLSTDGRLSKEQLVNWLRSHVAFSAGAREVLEEALGKAKRENKRVLVQETATWCGPCHMLSRFLGQNRVWEKDFVWVKMDHRMDGARETMQGLRGDASGGIPWFAILDADGNVLQTSNAPETRENIGFPSEDWAQEHFANMIRATKQRMTDGEIESFVAGLEPK